MSDLWHVCVLIPARNEEQLLPRCLESVIAAQCVLPVSISCDIIVVVDCSTDRTFDIATRMLEGRGIVVSSNAGSVGHVRAMAAEAGLARCRGPLHRCWLANTDADCCVSKSWLVDQLILCEQGVEAIAGIVEVDDFTEHSAGVDMLFRASYQIHMDGTHPHVHGANFGVRGDAYLHAGGWSKLCTAEDHDLWSRLARKGLNRVSVDRVKVLTSGRRIGRAPHGFAEALAAHNGLAYES